MRGDGRIFKRGNWLHIAYQFNGEEQREPALDKNDKNTNDPKVALAYLRARLKEVGADELGGRAFVTPKAAKITVREMIAELRLSLELDKKLSSETLCHLNRAEKDFGDFRAARLTAEQVEGIIKERLADGDRPATVNRALVYLRQAYTLAKQREILNRSPLIKHMNEDDGIRREFFSETEIAAIVEALPDDLKDFTRWCAATGQRKGEASSLTWSMVNGNELCIPGNVTKNKKPRTLPITGSLADIIERRRNAARVEVDGTVRMVPFIFHRAGRAVANFDKAWTTATEKANCPGKIFHSLRRSAVRRMVRAGISTAVAKLWSGHSTDAVFFRYAILDTKDMSAAFETVEKFRESERTEEKKIVSIGGSR